MRLLPSSLQQSCSAQHAPKTKDFTKLTLLLEFAATEGTSSLGDGYITDIHMVGHSGFWCLLPGFKPLAHGVCATPPASAHLLVNLDVHQSSNVHLNSICCRTNVKKSRAPLKSPSSCVLLLADWPAPGGNAARARAVQVPPPAGVRCRQCRLHRCAVPRLLCTKHATALRTGM